MGRKHKHTPEFRGSVHLFIFSRHTPSGQSRVYRVTQLRTDGVHCRESAGRGTVNLKVVPNECCHGRSPWTNSYSPLFPTPTIGMKWAVESTGNTPVLSTCPLHTNSVCVCFLPIYSGHQVRWTYQPRSHGRKVTPDFSSTFLLRCVP